jgi:hypothetical protein
MPVYTLYRLSDGEIAQIGDCHEDDLALQNPDPAIYGLIVGRQGNSATHRVNAAGSIIAKPTPVPPPAPPPTSEDVDRERDRRIFGGFSFQGTRFQSRAFDQDNISGAVQLAQMALAGGSAPNDYKWGGTRTTDFAFIAADNSEMKMGPATMVAMGIALAAHREAHIRAARAIKDRPTIPPDFAADKWWPAT